MEILRKVIHVGSLSIALLFRYQWFHPWMAIFIAGSGVVFNLFCFPKVGLIYRPEEPKRWGGVVYFPLSILVLVLLFWSWLDTPFAAAAGWSMMALGDGFAALLGKPFGRRRLPWNQKKTFVGLISFTFAAAIGTSFMIHWVGMRGPETVSWSFSILSGLTASLICGVLESLPIPIDDNLTVPITGAAFIFLLHLLC